MCPAPANAEVEEIARDLERYISLHPTAADTIGGIARWWLDCADPPALIHVEAALDSLVQRGLLVRNPLPDGNHIYARSSNQTGEPQCPKP